MKVLARIIVIVLIVLLILVGAVPLLVPIPPLEGTVSPEELADEDSLFVELNGLTVHMKSAGEGTPVLILLHGFGASVFSWREVLYPLGEWGSWVIAFDRPAYGLTERPMPGEWQGESPYSANAQVRLTLALLDRYNISRAVLVGNSAGGTVAVRFALAHPERVQALILVAPAIYAGGSPRWVIPLLRTPQARRIGPYLARSIAQRGDRLIRSAWYDPTKITPAVLEGYRKPLRTHNWDRALFEATIASQGEELTGRLSELRMPILVITGDSDTWVPTADSVRLAGELSNAELVVIPQCGHVPQEECPGPFLEAVTDFLERLPASL